MLRFSFASFTSLALGCFALLSAAACSRYQVVQHSPQGGVVALSGDDARAKAEEFMRSECPFGYRIVDEDESTRELRITYACKAPAQTNAQAEAREVSIRY